MKRIRSIGSIVGTIAFYTCIKFKKISLLNFSLFCEGDLKKRLLVKQTFKELGITFLEIICSKKLLSYNYDLLSAECNDDPHFQSSLDFLNQRLKNKEGIIFFSAHQGNWEIPFLLYAKQYPGLAIAKSLKNKFLNRWLISLRELSKGKIIPPQQALNKSIHYLKKGYFVGIVGDQALLSSSYSYSLFGKKAWTTYSPALLAYKTNCPVVNISMIRTPSGYKPYFSKPIFPNLKAPLKEEITRIMNNLMDHVKEVIEEHPTQWLWLHNRWKQKLSPKIKKQYRFSFILVILPKEPANDVFLIIKTLISIYTNSEFLFLVPQELKNQFSEIFPLLKDKMREYTKKESLLLPSSYYHVVFDFSCSKIVQSYYKKTGALEIFHITPKNHLSILKKLFIKPKDLQLFI